jgi:acetylornithine deacetylase
MVIVCFESEATGSTSGRLAIVHPGVCDSAGMPDLAALERDVVDAVDETELTRDLAELVAIASVDGTDAEPDAQRWCAERLGDLELEVDCWDIDVEDVRRRPDFPGMEVERSSALGCVGVLGADGTPPALALYGHTDVVPPGDPARWPGGDPFMLRVVDGAAWGRGTCDMKAGVAATIAAVAALRRAGVTLRRPLAVHCVTGEEDGGIGAYATLRRGHRASACVNAEPTSQTMIPANAGSLTFRLEVTGLATHGSTRYRGVSAVDKLPIVLQALRELEQRRNEDVPELFEHLEVAWPLSVGLVRAGDWASTVPDRLVAEGRYGVRVDETVPAAVAAFETAVKAVADADPWLRDHPVAVSWPGGRFGPGALPAGHRLLGDVSHAVQAVRGSAPPTVGAPYGSDLRHYVGAGIPTLQYGPGDVRYAHATDEHVELADVFACARVYALLALRMCG